MTEENIMTNDITVTISGWAATDPVKTTGPGRPFTYVRLGATPRYYDTAKAEWSDGKTEWFTVNMFRESLVDNVCESVRKGDPLLVTGRLRTREWQRENGETAVSVEIVADAIGHNLAYGQANFNRTIARRTQTSVPAQLAEEAVTDGNSEEAATAKSPNSLSADEAWHVD